MSESHKKKHLPPPPLADLLGELPRSPQESDQTAGPSAEPAPEVLGTLPAGPRDSGLKVNQRSAPAPEAQPTDDALKLPRGALVAMRRSGGLKFRSRQVVVYRDGRVNYDNGESGPRTVWTMSDAELTALHSLLDQADLPNLPAAGRQNPDAFAYEIVARPTRRVYGAEAFQGSIPAALAPLIKQLNRLAGMDEPNA